MDSFSQIQDVMKAYRDVQEKVTKSTVAESNRRMNIDAHNDWVLFDYRLETNLIESAQQTNKGITPQ